MGRNSHKKMFANRTALVQKEDKITDIDGNVIRKYEIRNGEIQDSDTSSIESDPEQPKKVKKVRTKKIKKPEFDKIETPSEDESENRSSSPSDLKQVKKGKKGFFGKFLGWFDHKKEVIRTKTRKYGARFGRRSMKRDTDEKISAAAMAVLAGR